MSEQPTGDASPTDSEWWTLRVTGAVSTPLELSLDALRAFDCETFTADFACAEGWVAPDRTWSGVRVQDLLSRAEPTASSRYALVRAADGEYACTFPLARLEDAVLALDLDGAPLTHEHGGPARLVPTQADSDCWESIKWVTQIAVTDREPAHADTAKTLALSRLE